MKKVLFVCTQNAGRSQMAEALFNRMAPEDIRAESAGQSPRREGVWPAVIEVMREIGVDVSRSRPTKLRPDMQLHADWAVTLACGATCPYVPTVVEDWDIPDPAGRSVDEVRVIREDHTAHQLRLMRILPGLIERFPELPDAEVRSCADAVLAEYDEVPVRSFVLALAERKARECLTSGGCAAPA